MTHANRLAKLEARRGTGRKLKYMVVISGGDAPPAWKAEDASKGFKVQPYTVERGGPGGDPFYLATREELDAFGARPDVELTLFEIFRAETPTGEGFKP